MDDEVVRVVTPFPLTDVQRSLIRTKMEKFLNKSFFVLQEEIDESLIGGVIIFVRDLIIDCSIKTQLEKIKEHVLRGEPK
ncbi:MAG: F0F1 ATP synthase subunit delta [Atribacterota bacterium]|nr:F0F1 ATP synthase subunit delta [Atribacterota bacterium]